MSELLSGFGLIVVWMLAWVGLGIPLALLLGHLISKRGW